MSRAIQDATACREGLRASPSSTSANFVSSGGLSTKPRPHRISAASCWCEPSHTGLQEVTLGGLRPQRQRQLRQIAQQFKQTGAVNTPPRSQLKPGTRLVREWQGRTYEVLVLDGGFSWQNTHHRSLSALARKITGTAWSGPLFFGLKPNRPANRRSSQQNPTGDAMESNNAAG